MKNQFIRLHLDFIGFSTSVLCAIHCAALPFLFSLAPLAGLQFLRNPWVEYVIILLSLFIASFALLHGYRKHHKRLLPLLIAIVGFVLILMGHLFEVVWKELAFTSSGAIAIAMSHLINWKYIRQAKIEFPECLSHNRSSKE